MAYILDDSRQEARNEFFNSIDDIKEWLSSLNISDYTLNDKMQVTVNQNVNISNKGITSIMCQFERINGDFDISNNLLTSLRGAPFTVYGKFNCSNNNISDFGFNPIIVNEYYANGYSNSLSVNDIIKTSNVIKGINFIFIDRPSNLEEEKEKVRNLCNYYKIKNFIIHNDLSVDVNGSVDLSSYFLKANNIPPITQIPIKFFKVSGDFTTSTDMNHGSMVGDLWIGNQFANNLTSLKNAPAFVGGSFECERNNLYSLIYAPLEVRGIKFNCRINRISSLQYSPTTLRDFNCSQNHITSLLGIQRTINGNFDCSYNSLSSLLFGPIKVGNMYCHNNRLESLTGGPNFVGSNYYCHNNAVKFTKEEVIASCKFETSNPSIMV